MTEAEKWLEENAIRCDRFEMRISPETCRRYQAEWPLRCQGCEQAGGVTEIPKQRPGEKWRRANNHDIQSGVQRKLEATVSKPGTKKTCTKCDEPMLAKGLCKQHYWRMKDEERKAKKMGQKKESVAESVGEMLAQENDPAQKAAEAIQAPAPLSETAAPAATHSHNVVTCRCGCGTVGRMHGRGLVKQCYDRIKRAGRLGDFPPLIDSPRAAEIASGGGKTVAHSGYDAAGFAKALDRVLAELRSTLVAKNKAYGDSALNPVRVFSKADPVEQLRVRIDDKLSRLMRGQDAGEDTEGDLLGYLVLLRVATAQAGSR